jgi:hypothetical protein
MLGVDDAPPYQSETDHVSNAVPVGRAGGVTDAMVVAFKQASSSIGHLQRNGALCFPDVRSTVIDLLASPTGRCKPWIARIRQRCAMEPLPNAQHVATHRQLDLQ